MNEQFIMIKDTIINEDQISYIEKFGSTFIQIYLKKKTDSEEVLQVLFKNEKERDDEFYRAGKKLCAI